MAKTATQKIEKLNRRRLEKRLKSTVAKVEKILEQLEKLKRWDDSSVHHNGGNSFFETHNIRARFEPKLDELHNELTELTIELVQEGVTNKELAELFGVDTDFIEMMMAGDDEEE